MPKNQKSKARKSSLPPVIYSGMVGRTEQIPFIEKIRSLIDRLVAELQMEPESAAMYPQPAPGRRKTAYVLLRSMEKELCSKFFSLGFDQGLEKALYITETLLQLGYGCAAFTISSKYIQTINWLLDDIRSADERNALLDWRSALEAIQAAAIEYEQDRDQLFESGHH